MHRALSTLMVAALCATIVLVAPGHAHASVIVHVVTPANVGTTDGIDVTVVERRGDDLVLRLTIERAPVGVYPARLRARPGADEQVLSFENPDADPLVVVVTMPSADAVVTVMRDYGLIGHSYVVRASDWR